MLQKKDKKAAKATKVVTSRTNRPHHKAANVSSSESNMTSDLKNGEHGGEQPAR